VSTSWKVFLTQTKTYVDVNGNGLTITLPPSWIVELQLWEMLESSLLNNPQEFGFGDPESVIQALSFFTGLSVSEIENRFDSETIELMFFDLWESIKPLDEEVKEAEQASMTVMQQEVNLFTHSLAMFAVECGWAPYKVLSMPKRQINMLGAAVSDYIANRLRFQAAIHGAELDGDDAGKNTQNVTKLDDIDVLRDLQMKGLPIEVQ
jgi:hypothetical protein